MTDFTSDQLIERHKMGQAYKAKTQLWPAFAGEEPCSGRFWTSGWTGQLQKMQVAFLIPGIAS